MKYHYTYRITNSRLNKHYYGARTSNVIPSKDLGIKYFSSSSDTQFREDQKNNPQDYKYIIVSEFDSREEAVELEIKLHTKFNVGLNESFYNKTRQSVATFDNTGIKASFETRSKQRKAAAKIKDTKKYREDKSRAAKGRVHYHDPSTGEHRMFLPEEVLAGFVKGRIGTPQQKLTCPHCKLVGGINVMHRWHFDNCKRNINTFNDINTINDRI